MPSAMSYWLKRFEKWEYPPHNARLSYKAADELLKRVNLLLLLCLKKLLNSLNILLIFM